MDGKFSESGENSFRNFMNSKCESIIYKCSTVILLRSAFTRIIIRNLHATFSLFPISVADFCGKSPSISIITQNGSLLVSIHSAAEFVWSFFLTVCLSY